jgi:carboxymethylenebutenolidase
MRTLEIPTPDGTCRTMLVGSGPGVILVMDAGGPREALFTIATELAARGFAVAVPDLMYRVGSPFELLGPGLPRDTPSFFNAMRTDAVFRAALNEKYIRSATAPANVENDFAAILPALEPHFAPGRIGLTGYCMGGGIALRVASLFPTRIGAVASFHGGYLATSSPESPHLGLPRVNAEVFVAGAVEDGSFSPELRDRLVASLEAAKVPHRVETWQGKHGFAVPDFPVFDAQLYARHLDVMAELFQRSSEIRGNGARNH